MRKMKLLNSLSLAGLAAATLSVSACGGEGEGEGEGEGAEGATHLAGEGEGEGEGASEGEGEGDGGSSGGAVFNDVDYIYHLALVRGHLAAFAELYKMGAYDMAATHAKHPGSEIYAELVPSFEARKQKGFADELNALVAAATAREPIDDAYDAVKAKLRASAPPQTAKSKIMAISRIVRTAGEELAIGVSDDGTVKFVHEYQDAYGFLLAAREFAEAVTPKTEAETAARQATIEQIDLALAEFDGLIADTTQASPEVIFGAAARIEIASLGLD